jgi:hypothetical protein
MKVKLEMMEYLTPDHCLDRTRIGIRGTIIESVRLVCVSCPIVCKFDLPKRVWVKEKSIIRVFSDRSLPVVGVILWILTL